MNHSVAQNGPFCEVKRLILKKHPVFLSFLSDSFPVSTQIVVLKRTKIHAENFSNFY